MAAPPGSWMLVANVRAVTTRGDAHLPRAQQRGAREERGTRHFRAGAKLWLAPAQWGDGYERARAIGRHSGGMRLVEMVVLVRDLEKFRVKQCFNPGILERCLPWDEATAREVAARLNAKDGPTPT